jgi:hypothetical protein
VKAHKGKAAKADQLDSSIDFKKQPRKLLSGRPRSQQCTYIEGISYCPRLGTDEYKIQETAVSTMPSNTSPAGDGNLEVSPNALALLKDYLPAEAVDL